MTIDDRNAYYLVAEICRWAEARAREYDGELMTVERLSDEESEDKAQRLTVARDTWIDVADRLEAAGSELFAALRGGL